MRRAAQRSCGLLLRQHVSCLEITRNSIAGQADLFLAIRAASQVSIAARQSQHQWQDHSFFQPRPFQSWSAVHQLAASPSTASKNDNKDEVKSPLENQKEISSSTSSATPGAQLCDAVLDHLRATKSKVERNQTGETTWLKIVLCHQTLLFCRLSLKKASMLGRMTGLLHHTCGCSQYSLQSWLWERACSHSRLTRSS